ARMLTDNLARQLWLSAAAATVAGTGGYLLAAFGPQLWGSAHSLGAAGTIAVVAGALQVLAMAFAPRYGVATRALRRRSRRFDLPA
ncbi:MAG: metal ABC transporter permease, partial [Rhodospirillaceae bacterium]